jgi:biopolymer transport protein ExbD
LGSFDDEERSLNPMRFKSQQQEPEVPEIELVPMMDVLMAVLTFFILISMTLTNQQQGVSVQLPRIDRGSKVSSSSTLLLVELTQQAEIKVTNQLVSEAQLIQKVQTFLSEQTTGTILLKADRKLPYEQVVQLLAKLRDVGGDRVSLAVSKF